MKASARPDTPSWREALATVTACKYEFGAGRALAFGIPLRKHFRISFNYWVNGELHTGEFTSVKPVPQGQLLPITYNPDAPHEHDQANAAPGRSLLFTATLITVVILLSVLSAFIRSCH